MCGFVALLRPRCSKGLYPPHPPPRFIHTVFFDPLHRTLTLLLNWPMLAGALYPALGRAMTLPPCFLSYGFPKIHGSFHSNHALPRGYCVLMGHKGSSPCVSPSPSPRPYWDVPLASQPVMPTYPFRPWRRNFTNMHPAFEHPVSRRVCGSARVCCDSMLARLRKWLPGTPAYVTCSLVLCGISL